MLSCVGNSGPTFDSFQDLLKEVPLSFKKVYLFY